jgi:hypothetical protein
VVLSDSAYAESLYINKSPGGNGDAANQLSAWRVAVEHQFNFIYTWFPVLKLKRKNKIVCAQSFAAHICVCCSSVQHSPVHL